MVFIDNYPGIAALDNIGEALFDFLKSPPIAPRGERVAHVFVSFVCFRIPGSAAHAFDQLQTDLISFYRNRVKGIGHISVLDDLQIGLRIARQSGRGWEVFGNGAAHHINAGLTAGARQAS